MKIFNVIKYLKISKNICKKHLVSSNLASIQFCIVYSFDYPPQREAPYLIIK